MFSFGLLGIIDDAVTWLQAAALVLAIAGAAAVMLAALVVGYIPFGEYLPGIGRYVKPARLVAFLTFGALCALVTVQLATDRCAALRAADREAAERARIERDDGITRHLKETYQPELSRLARLNAELRRKAADYAKRKPVVKVVGAGGSCRLGAAARQLRPHG